MRDELWLKHDARSRLDPKMAHFFNRRGVAGYGVFWALIEIFHYQNDHQIDLQDELPGVALQLGLSLDDLRAIINDIVECKLFKLENGKLYQARLKADQAERSTTKHNILLQKREAARLGGVRSGEARRNAKKDNSLESLEESKQNEASALKHEANELDKRDKRDKNININSLPRSEGSFFLEGNVGKVVLGDLVIPKELRAPEACGALVDWLVYKRKIKQGYSDAQTVSKLLDYWKQFGSKVFIEEINKSIRNRWAGIHEPSSSKRPPETKRVQPLSKVLEPVFVRNEEQKRKDRAMLIEKFPALASKLA